jgi:hypothetical protein
VKKREGKGSGGEGRGQAGRGQETQGQLCKVRRSCIVALGTRVLHWQDLSPDHRLEAPGELRTNG